MTTVVLLVIAVIVGLLAGAYFSASIKKEINAAESSIGAKLYGLHDRLTVLEKKLPKVRKP